MIPSFEKHTFATADDGTRLFVRRREGDHGEGTPYVLFCDGIACDGFVWKYLWDDLAPLARLAHWNYRGHGRSGAPRDPERVDIKAHASDLARVREHLGSPTCIIIGHSMGTQVCLEAAHRYPEGLAAMILICGSYGKVTQSFRGVPVLDVILPRITSWAKRSPGLVRALWSRIPEETALKIALKSGDIDGTRMDPEDLRPYLQHMKDMDFPLFLRMLRAAGDHSAEDFLADLTIPTMVVAGEKDTFTPAPLSRFMAERIPNAELLLLEGGSHAAPLEQPDKLAQAIASFVRGHVRELSRATLAPKPPVAALQGG